MLTLAEDCGNLFLGILGQLLEPLDAVGPDLFLAAGEVELLLHLDQLLGSPLPLLLLQFDHVLVPVLQVVDLLLEDVLRHHLLRFLKGALNQLVQLPHLLHHVRLLSCYFR